MKSLIWSFCHVSLLLKIHHGSPRTRMNSQLRYVPEVRCNQIESPECNAKEFEYKVIKKHRNALSKGVVLSDFFSRRLIPDSRKYGFTYRGNSSNRWIFESKMLSETAYTWNQGEKEKKT